MEHDNKTIDPEGFLLVDYSWKPTTNFTGKVKWPSGSKYWYKDGLYHREDSPAVEYADGRTAWWYKDGKLHREDGPAIVFANGETRWYINNKRHREDGPAIEYADGRTAWWYNDVEGLENFPPEIKKKLARIFLHEA